MKTTRFSLAVVALVLLLGGSVPRALAVTAREGFEVIDFPNDAASVTAPFTYTVDVGTHLFSGVIPFASGDADFLKITLLPGRKVTGIFTNGASGINLPATPLYAGTYTLSCSPGVVISNVNWSIVFTVDPAPDYEVTTTGGQMIVTDRSGFGDTLTVSEPFAGTIKFAAPGRTFSLNGAAFITGDSGSIAHAGIFDITVNAGAGSDTIAVGAFASQLPGLTINGGTGDDTVNFTGDITFRSNRSLDVNLQDDDDAPGVDSVNVAAGANVTTSGLSTIRVACSRSVTVAAGGSLESGGALYVFTNQQLVPTPGDFIGVNVSGGTISGASFGFVEVSATS